MQNNVIVEIIAGIIILSINAGIFYLCILLPMKKKILKSKSYQILKSKAETEVKKQIADWHKNNSSDGNYK